MNLTDWAIRHNISAVAIAELRRMMLNVPDFEPTTQPEGSEAAVQNRVRLAAATAGWKLFRNNVGVLKDERGVPVRFGLANDSAAINKVCKSSDLIGIKPGGQFVCREVKSANWKYRGTPREVAQLAWIQMILAMGGDAKFTTGNP